MFPLQSEFRPSIIFVENLFILTIILDYATIIQKFKNIWIPKSSESVSHFDKCCEIQEILFEILYLSSNYALSSCLSVCNQFHFELNYLTFYQNKTDCLPNTNILLIAINQKMLNYLLIKTIIVLIWIMLCLVCDASGRNRN